MRADAPGRIPESLIDAAIDGELNADIQREIAHALQYDPIRKQELLDTNDAINALQMPISTPDFADVVLARADRHRKFIPAQWRSHVRAGRLGIAAALLMTLMSVAGLQRIYPRLTTFASHPTPVLNIEQAVGNDANVFANNITCEVENIRTRIQPLASLLPMPGKTNHHFDTTLASSRSLRSSTSSQAFPTRSPANDLRFVTIGNGFSTLYVFNFNQDIATPREHHSLRLLGTNAPSNWAFASTNLVRFPNQDTKASPAKWVELNVPALP